MRTRNLLLVGIATILISCDVETIGNLGMTDCAVELRDILDNAENNYQELMIQPDSQGNDQSLESCLNRRFLTEEYTFRLYAEQTNNSSREGCTDDERTEFDNRIANRIQDLEEDMENIWDHCEELYGED